MPVDIGPWMALLVNRLQDCFGSRLVFIGLQGSYRRGEASPDSDIDAVVILDELGVGDLIAYRELVRQMPHSELACGFVSGRTELESWLPAELFQFYHDTRPLYGSLDFLLPRFGQEDFALALHIGACGLYHACCHSLLFSDADAALPALLKSSFFLLQAKIRLERGIYAGSREALRPYAQGDDAAVLSLCLLPRVPPVQMQGAYELLLRWSGGLIRSMTDRGTSDD